MKTPKITAGVAWIIASVLSVMVAAGIFFGLIKPSMDETEKKRAFRDQRQQVANQLGTEQKREKKVKAEKAAVEAEWARYDRALMPRINMADLWQAWGQLRREQRESLGPSVDKFLMADKSVTVVEKSLSLPPPPEDPNQVKQAQPYIFSLGSVRVRGTFPNIMKHVRRWNNFNRVILVEGLSLAGQSPRLEATYTLTAYVWAQNADKPGPAFPWAGGSGAGGMMGGPPGGGMGGPPPGMGGPPGGSSMGGYGAAMSGGPPPGMGGPPPGGGGGS